MSDLFCSFLNCCSPLRVMFPYISLVGQNIIFFLLIRIRLLYQKEESCKIWLNPNTWLCSTTGSSLCQYLGDTVQSRWSLFFFPRIFPTMSLIAALLRESFLELIINRLIVRCSLLRSRSRRFDCLMLVSIRRWGRLLMRCYLYYGDLMRLADFDPHCSG